MLYWLANFIYWWAIPTSPLSFSLCWQIFDILPIRSFLRPGESEEVEFVYYGHANRKAVGKCACDVTGGPTYTVDLVGEASNVGFR